MEFNNTVEPVTVGKVLFAQAVAVLDQLFYHLQGDQFKDFGQREIVADDLIRYIKEKIGEQDTNNLLPPS